MAEAGKTGSEASREEVLALRKDSKLATYRVQALINVLAKAGIIAKDDVQDELDELLLKDEPKEDTKKK